MYLIILPFRRVYAAGHLVVSRLASRIMISTDATCVIAFQPQAALEIFSEGTTSLRLKSEFK